MSEDRELRIRQHAYALWEQEGRPEGRHEHHWQQASQQMGDEMLQQQGAMEEQPQQQGDMGTQTPTGESIAGEQQQG